MTTRAYVARSVLLAGLGLLCACSSVAAAGDGAGPTGARSKPNETETLQKATALAHGNLAWEIVKISDVKREPDKVTWDAWTRSEHMRCSGAVPDGAGAYCEPLPDSPGL
jgi:hypothetical protein